MSFANPEYILYGLLLAALLAVVLYRSYLERSEDLKNLLGSWRIRHFKGIYLVKSLISGIGILAAVFFFSLAASGISWGSVSEEDPRAGMDVALILDVSRSMEARDLAPSRLKRGIETFRSLLSNLPGARFSLTVYKGKAVVLSPLTQDRGLLETLLEHAGPSLLEAPGSAPASGIQAGFSTFSFPSPRHRVAVLLTDGENMEGNPIREVQKGAASDIILHVLGAGGDEPVTIPFGSGTLKEGDQSVKTRQDQGFLRDLARAGRGEYFNLSDQGIVSKVIRHLQASASVSGGVRLKSVNRYSIFIYLGLLSLVISMGARLIRWKKLF